MPIELVGIAINALTFIVVAVTAAAATIQLRHLRASNQLSGLLTILHYSQDDREQERRNFVLRDLETRLQDADFRKSLEQHPVDPQIHKELHVCDFFEQIGNYMKRGLIDEDAYLDTACDFVDAMWRKLEPAIAIMRRTRDNSLYDNFEYLVVRSRAWLARHPNGAYPYNAPRLTVKDEWLASDRRTP